MYLYHITMFDKEFQTVLRPKIPEGNRKISRYKVWSGKSEKSRVYEDFRQN